MQETPQRRYYEKHKEKYNEYGRNYYHRNVEKCALRAKEWRENNKDYRRTKQREDKRQRKLEAIEYKGGKCERCGYNKCIQALDFHHINPKEKDFTISGGTKSFESLKSELDKCILVCKNCHSEIHAGIYPLTDTE